MNSLATTSSLLIGLFDNWAGVKSFVPAGPLGGGAVPVPPVKSTLILTPAGPQGPDVPAMLQSVAFLVFSLRRL